MIWTILLFVLLFIILLLLVVLVGSLIVEADLAYKEQSFTGQIYLRWIHPLLFHVKYDFASGETSGRFLWHRILDIGEEEKLSPEESVSPQNKAETEQKLAPPSRAEEEPAPSEMEQEQIAPEQDKTTGKKRGLISRIRSGLDRLRKKRLVNLFLDGQWRRKIVKWSLSVLRALMRIIRFKQLSVFLKFGLEDPAHMGQLFGYLTAVRNIVVQRRKKYQFSMEPVFMQYMLEFDCRLKLKTSLWMVTFPFIVAVVRFPYLHTFLLWRRIGRESKARVESSKVNNGVA